MNCDATQQFPALLPQVQFFFSDIYLELTSVNRKTADEQQQLSAASELMGVDPYKHLDGVRLYF